MELIYLSICSMLRTFSSKKMKNILYSLLFLAGIIYACQPGKADELSEALPTTTIILVRHAEKADDGTTDPGLTPEGLARAQRLARTFAPTGVDGIYSTSYERTRSTAKPLAELAGLEVKTYDPKDQEFISKLVTDHPGETLLVVGHSNTVPGMVNTLVGESTYQNLDEMEYDKLFIVAVTGGKGQALELAY